MVCCRHELHTADAEVRAIDEGVHRVADEAQRLRVLRESIEARRLKIAAEVRGDLDAKGERRLEQQLVRTR
jgi:hypothetical protein